MEYTTKRILVMLQDLQRIHFGRISMTVSSYVMEEGGPSVNGCVFDKYGEPHSFNFYSFESEEKHKEEYLKLFKLVYENTAE